MAYKNTSSFPSLKRQWVNWIVMLLIEFLVITGYAIPLPSMHQFITNSKESKLQEHERQNLMNDLKAQPGLGDSEYVYSWIVTAYALGETVGAVVSGLVTNHLPYHISTSLGCVIEIVAGVLYALTINSIMIFTARFLMGFFGGYFMVLLSCYVSESADWFEALSNDERKANKDTDVKKGKSKQNLCLFERFSKHLRKRFSRKDVLFLLHGLIKACFSPSSLAIASIMAKFPTIDQFRWPGWFIAATSAMYIVVFLILYKKPHCSKTCTGDMQEDNTKDQLQNERHNKYTSCYKYCSVEVVKRSLVYAFLILAGYANGTFYTVLDTLINPILSDQFGFGILDISNFLLAIMILPLVAVVFVTVIKTLVVDNRNVLAALLFISIAGGIIISDWQAISNDPCSTFCTSTNNSQLLISNSSIETQCTEEKLKDFRSLFNLTAGEIADLCEAAGIPGYTCFWNPQSRITGKYCSDCTQRCSSIQKSLYFWQLCIGLVLGVFTLHMTLIFVIILASDYTPAGHQATIIGAINMANAVSRIVNPLWSVWLYEASDKHTYAVLSVKTLIILIVLVMLLLLYKQVAPKTSSRNKHEEREYGITATSKEDGDSESDKELQSELLSSRSTDSDESTESE